MPSTLLADLRDPRPYKDDRRVLHFQYNGYMVLVGKNSFSNERLVSEHPHRDCLWMHAMASRGSHVIVCVHGLPEPDEHVIQYAARLALHHSHSEARTVSVSLLRDVFKPEDGGPGVFKTTRPTAVEVES